MRTFTTLWGKGSRWAVLPVVGILPMLAAAFQTNPSFVENKGQWPAQVLYYNRLPGVDAWVTAEGLVMDYYETIYSQDRHGMRRMTGRKGHVLRFKMHGAAAAAVEHSQPLPGYYNYFIGDDPGRWATRVRRYSEVTLKEVYDGVDVRYYVDGQWLRYDFVVHPGGDAERIRIQIEGADEISIDETTGELVIRTRFGQVRHGGLYAYQTASEQAEAVTARFIQRPDGTIGFAIGEYDPKRPLIIDPFIYSTYLGGGYDDAALGMVVNGAGEVYVAGKTASPAFPTTTGAYDQTHNSPGNSSIGQPPVEDVFVTRLNAAGSALVFSTFVGGDDQDVGWDIDFIGSGGVVVVGRTFSSNFPTTNGAISTSLNGNYDAFIFRLNDSGTALLHSTYLGGGDYDEAMGVARGSNDTLYVVGATKSNDFPTTFGVYDDSHNGGWDVFVVKVNPALTALMFSTYIGGPLDDNGHDIVLDDIDRPLITGDAELFYPTTAGAYQSFPNGYNDAFVSKLSRDGSQLLYSTYIGGDSFDYAHGIALHNGKAAIVGKTLSSNYPTTSSAYDATPNGDYDVFVTLFNNTGAALEYSTYIGGTGWDDARSVITDGFALYVTGRVDAGYPSTSNACDPSHNGVWDAFLSKVVPSLSGAPSLAYSTFIGGSGGEIGWDVARNGNDLFVCGETGSNDFPTTSGAYDQTSNGGFDAFVTKLCAGIVPVEWVDFSAEPQKDGSVRLQWTTASERGSLQFVIERSADGKAFEAIGKVPAAGHSVSLRRYEWVDRNPLGGWSYYRLRQEDLDGGVGFSEVRKVWIGPQADLALHPNPAHEWLTVTFPTENNEPVQVEITDMTGKRYAPPIRHHNGRYIVDVRSLPPGMYVLSVVNGEGIPTHRNPFVIHR